MKLDGELSANHPIEAWITVVRRDRRGNITDKWWFVEEGDAINFASESGRVESDECGTEMVCMTDSDIPVDHDSDTPVAIYDVDGGGSYLVVEKGVL